MSSLAQATQKRARSWGEFLPPAVRIRLVVIAALLLVVYWAPIKRDMVSRWLSDGNWSHGWLVPVFSLYFLITKRDQLFAAIPRTNYLGLVLLLASLGMYFVSALWFRMAYPQALSLLGAIFAITLFWGGWPIMRLAWFPIAYLAFAVPLPQSYYVSLTMPLRQISTIAATKIMPLFAPGLFAKAQNVVIDYSYQGNTGVMNIADACSGMRLLISLLALGIAVSYLGDRPSWQRITMVAFVFPIAIFCNIVRVTITGLFQVYGRPDLAQGSAHQMLGMVMLALALGLFLLVGYVLSHLIVEEDELEGPASPDAA